MNLLEKIAARHKRVERWWLDRYPGYKFSQTHRDRAHLIEVLGGVRQVFAALRTAEAEGHSYTTSQIEGHVLDAIDKTSVQEDTQ